jgi:hypothetical protein
MHKEASLQSITEQINRLAQIRTHNPDKTLSYQHAILKLLLQEKTTRSLNDQLSKQLQAVVAQHEAETWKAA